VALAQAGAVEVLTPPFSAGLLLDATRRAIAVATACFERHTRREGTRALGVGEHDPRSCPFHDPFTGRLLPLDEIRRHAVEEALAACEGNATEAARLLGVSRATLYRYRRRAPAE
jgi:transcriptional regulator of acetoin/glycerol metabolism